MIRKIFRKHGQLYFWLIIFSGFLLAGPASSPDPPNAASNPVIISEFLAANQSGLADEDGEYVDWIELYNSGERPVNLSGWALTDDPNQPDKWTFPDITLDSQSYLLVFASDKDRKSGQLHTNFKLSRQGEFLGLYNVWRDHFVDLATTQIVHGISVFPQQFDDVAFGRVLDVNQPGQPPPFRFLTQPTPGTPNLGGQSWAGLTKPVTFSSPHGFYESPFSLMLTTLTPEAIIRYTTDGTPPSETHGQIYSAPIPIQTTTLLRAIAYKPGEKSAPIQTQSFIFLEDVLYQGAEPPGFPPVWGGYHGRPIQADYEMDPDVVSDPRYRAELKEALKAIPSLSLVTDNISFHDLYANPRRKGIAWERPVSVELIDPTGEQAGFQIDAGLRIQGDLGRSEYIPKHPFRLFFRRQYGAGRLDYPLFENSTVQSFDTLVLRSGVNRSYAGYPDRPEDITNTTYTRDEWLRRSQIDMSGIGSHGLFVHLYINGLYWGVYNLVERPDDAFMANYFGGAEDDWQTISHQETLSHGSKQFEQLHQLAAEGNLVDPQRYAMLQTYLDLPHFADYLILNWYAGNIDWAFNNWYVGVGPNAEPAKYFVWDGERTWYDGAEIFMDRDEYKDLPNLVRPLFEALLENPDFRMLLADRLYKHLFHSGALSENRARARWLQINQPLEQAILAESARWGDTWNNPPLTQIDWFQARDDVLSQVDGNADQLIDLARVAEYYPLVDPPTVELHDSVLTMSGGDGLIYYTLDGVDPRLSVSGDVASTAKLYQEPVRIDGSRQVKARTWADGIWSALNESILQKEGRSGELVISEIMYNPPGGSDYEFIELRNVGDGIIDLTGLSFEGIRYTFPADTYLTTNEILVLARNHIAFAERYPNSEIFGLYEGQLSNKGEKITLSGADEQVVISITYDDDDGWPLSADGGGASLVLKNLISNPNDLKNWQASQIRYGTPGQIDK